MRGVAQGLEEIKKKEANERIRFIRNQYGIIRGDGRHVRFFCVTFFEGQGPYWVYQLSDDHNQDCEIGLPHFVLFSYEPMQVRDSNIDETRCLMSGNYDRAFLD